MFRFPRLVILIAAGALAAAIVPTSAPAVSDAPTATTAKSCPTRTGAPNYNYDKYGPDYVLWIKARRVSCRKARERVKAFHDCRPGKSGYCPNLGAWNCTEDRGPTSPHTYYSTVKCKHNRKVVRHRYQQNR